MRNLLLTLTFLLSAITAFAQDSEPMPWSFVWAQDSLPRPFEPDSFKQTSILTGFQWSGKVQMMNALQANCRA